MNPNQKKNSLFSTLTLGLVAGVIALGPSYLAQADDQPATPVTSDPQKAELKQEIKAKKQEIREDRKKLRDDAKAHGKDSPEVQADKAELKKVRGEKKVLAQKRHALRKGKKTSGQPTGGETQPAPAPVTQ